MMVNQEELQNDIEKSDPSEVECQDCKGCGFIASTICNTCHGDGKLDWVENVVGKHPKSYGSIFKYDRKTGKVIRVD